MFDALLDSVQRSSDANKINETYEIRKLEMQGRKPEDKLIEVIKSLRYRVDQLEKENASLLSQEGIDGGDPDVKMEQTPSSKTRAEERFITELKERLQKEQSLKQHLE